MAGTEYGYIRVSTKEQHEDRQLVAMEEFGIPQKRIYLDKQSGKNFDRPNYKRLLSRLRPGDTVVVKSIDRLGRNYDEIQNQWRYITRTRQANIVVLDMPLLDTRQKGQDLTGIFVADLVLQILSYVAQVERENIRQRQAEGIAASRARGVKFGRPSAPLPDNFEAVHQAWRAKELTLKEAAKKCQMPEGTFYSKARKLENAECADAAVNL